MSSADDRYVIIKKTEKGWCVVLGGRNHFLLEAHKKKKNKKNKLRKKFIEKYLIVKTFYQSRNEKQNVQRLEEKEL